MSTKPRKRTILNGHVHEGFGEKVANEPEVTSLTAPEEEFCPACQGFMKAEEMGLPLQAAHRGHIQLTEPFGLPRIAEEKSREDYTALEKRRAIRLEQLYAEYQPTMSSEVLRAWAADVAAALVPTELTAETNDSLGF